MPPTTTTPDTIRLRYRFSSDSLTSRAPADLDTELARFANVPSPPPIRTTADLPIVPDQTPRTPDDVRVTIDPPTRFDRFVIRAFDLTVAGIGIVVLAPLMLLVAIAVVVDSPGPIFYGSTRVGRRKPRFKAWKFRSMRPDADAVLATLLATDRQARAEYEEYHKLRDDPRLTRLGSFIRRTSLDELPQLFNIIKGEMSVVGPRPKSEVDADVFGPALDIVLLVKPGLTGLWQVSGRNQVAIQDRVAMDIEYALTRTMAGDLLICLKTFLQLWQPARNGAY